ncbi:MAG: GPW/gp25 family protein [Gemmatimonadaceae bacterium]
MDIDFPFQFDEAGRTATTDTADHVRDMLEQLLLTSPGERVNRPDFGSGLLHMVFTPNSPELAAALEFSVRAAIDAWLGDIVSVEQLSVTSEEGMLRVELQYADRRTGERRATVIEKDIQ